MYIQHSHNHNLYFLVRTISNKQWTFPSCTLSVVSINSNKWFQVRSSILKSFPFSFSLVYFSFFFLLSFYFHTFSSYSLSSFFILGHVQVHTSVGCSADFNILFDFDYLCILQPRRVCVQCG